jgi:hypothetical protein
VSYLKAVLDHYRTLRAAAQAKTAAMLAQEAAEWPEHIATIRDLKAGLKYQRQQCRRLKKLTNVQREQLDLLLD